MNEREQHVVSQTEHMIKEMFLHDQWGHDRRHIYRVRNLALYLAKEENASPYLVSLIALLHDIADYKFHDGHETIWWKKAREWLEKLWVEEEIIKIIQQNVDNISFKWAHASVNLSLDGQVVQDADRLDAIGAIGIARTFAYGGAIGRPIYDPLTVRADNITKEEYMKKNVCSITHFYDKLLRVKDLMNTKTWWKVAKQRHEYVENFLKEFYLEWDGKDIIW